MSNTASPLDHLFAPRTLADVHTELMRVMAELREQDSPHRDEARNLFKENQKAKTDVEAAEELLLQIRNLGQPVPTNLTLTAQDLQAAPPSPVPVEIESTPPIQQSAPVEIPSVSAPGLLQGESAVEDETTLDSPLDPPEEGLQQEEAAAEPEAEDTLEEGELPGEDESDEVTETEATLAPAALLPVATIEWPEGTLGEGLFSQLAATLGAGESLSLVLARSKGKAQLLVTVQPVPIAGELNATAVPLQINGTPASLDDQLIPQMTAFRTARAVARETTDYLGQVKAAAEQAKKAAEDARKKASKPASSATAAAKKPASDGSLKLEVAPADAMIVLTDSAGKTHAVKHNKDVPLPVGEYTVIVEADGYARHEEKITIRSNSQTKKGVILLKASAERLL